MPQTGNERHGCASVCGAIVCNDKRFSVIAGLVRIDSLVQAIQRKVSRVVDHVEAALCGKGIEAGALLAVWRVLALLLFSLGSERSACGGDVSPCTKRSCSRD